jgi:hypothetical protein
LVGITARGLDDPTCFSPKMETFICDATPWDPLSANLPMFEHYPLK